MAKRSKELFELLRQQREAAETARLQSAEAECTGQEASEVEVTASASRGRARFEEPDDDRGILVSPSEEARGTAAGEHEQTSQPGIVSRLAGYAKLRGTKHTSKDGGIGGRKVALSLNFILFFVVAFLLTNVMSYMVGSMQRDESKDDAELSVKLNKYWAVQVTPLLDIEKERRFAWDLRNLLIGEGFPGAEVHRTTLNNRAYLRTIASKHGDRRACVDDARRANEVVSRLMQSGKLDRKTTPIEISIISIQETEKSTGNSSSHVNP